MIFIFIDSTIPYSVDVGLKKSELSKLSIYVCMESGDREKEEQEDLHSPPMRIQRQYKCLQGMEVIFCLEIRCLTLLLMT